MELKFEKTACRCLRQIAYEVQNQEQTQELRLTDGLPDIGRILCSWGQVILRSKEWQDDGMSASGGIMVWVLYAPDDGSEPQCVDTWLPFQVKWSFPETRREGRICLTPLLRSVDARTVSARKMMVRASIGILGEALETGEEDIFRPGETSDGVEVLRNTYPIRLPKEVGEKTFVLDEELSLPSSCPAMEKILHFELLPQLLDRKVMAGKVVFRGHGLLHVLYRSQSGELVGWDFEIPFSQFGDVEEEVSPDADARMTFAVTNLELEPTGEGMLRLKCGIVAQYIVDDQMMIELAQDAYGTNRAVTPYFQALNLPALLDEHTEQISVELPLEIQCSRVVDVCFIPDHPRMNRMGDQISSELSGMFQLLYEDQDGVLQCSSKRWEKQCTFEADYETTVNLYAIQLGSPTVSVNSGGVSVSGNVNLFARTANERGLTMITGMDLGDVKQPDPDRPSVILRRAEGERLWDMAKSCGTSVSAISQANGLQSEPILGQLLLIPVP